MLERRARTTTVEGFAQDALIWSLGQDSDKDVLTAAASRIARWLDSDVERLNRDEGDVELAVVALRADAALFDRLAERIEHSRDADERHYTWGALGLVRDPPLLRRTLDMALRLELSPRELRWLFFDATQEPPTRKVTFDWISSNWAAIKSKWKPAERGPILDVIDYACLDEQRQALETFFYEQAPEKSRNSLRPGDSLSRSQALRRRGPLDVLSGRCQTMTIDGARPGHTW